MPHKLTAARGADRIVRYSFAEGTVFADYHFAFSVYDGQGGPVCFTVAGSDAAGSSITVSGNVIEVYLDKDDIDALPVESEAGAARICAFDFFATAPGGITAKVHGGPFVVLPWGAEGTSDVDAVTVAIGTVDYDITVAGGGSVLKADNKALPIAVFGAAAVVQLHPDPKPGLRAPFPMQVSEVRASLIAASDNGGLVIDVLKNGTSILDTAKLTVPQGALTSLAGTPCVPMVKEIGDDDAISIDVLAAGDGATGLTVTLIYRVTP